MQSLNTPHLDIVGTPRWLSRLYAYVGAENNPHRYENERDRALQRIAMPTVSIAWVFAFHQWVGTPVDASETVWCIAAFAYAVCSAVYRMYLRRHPTGGVHAQYAFLALDPLIVGWALLAAPEALAWWLVLMLVMIVSNDRAALGERTNGRLLNVLGWTTTAIMGLAAIGLVITTILG